MWPSLSKPEWVSHRGERWRFLAPPLPPLGSPVSLPPDCGDWCKECRDPAWHTAEYRWRLGSLKEGQSKKKKKENSLLTPSHTHTHTSEQRRLNPVQPLWRTRAILATHHAGRKRDAGEWLTYLFIKICLTFHAQNPKPCFVIRVALLSDDGLVNKKSLLSPVDGTSWKVK